VDLGVGRGNTDSSPGTTLRSFSFSVIEGTGCSTVNYVKETSDTVDGILDQNQKYQIDKKHSRVTVTPRKTGRTTSIVACEVHAAMSYQTENNCTAKTSNRFAETSFAQDKRTLHHMPGVSIAAIQASLIASALKTTRGTKGSRLPLRNCKSVSVDMIDKCVNLETSCSATNIDNDTTVGKTEMAASRKNIKISTRHTFSPYIAAQEPTKS
jgi:hypothetical protein